MTSLLRITKLSALWERTSLCARPIKISLSISMLRVGENNYISLKNFILGSFPPIQVLVEIEAEKKDFT